MIEVNWDDRIRVSRVGGSDGMGQAVSLSRLFGLGGGQAPDLETLAAREQPGVRNTHFVLTNLLLPVVSVTTGNGVGGVELYQFPEGYIQRYYARAKLSVGVETQADFTDGTPEGDIGVGSLAPANADSFGTDATDDDWATGAAFTMVDYLDSEVICEAEAAAVLDGSTTAEKLFLNVLVDAADIDDGVTTNLVINGDIWVTWGHLGD